MTCLSKRNNLKLLSSLAYSTIAGSSFASAGEVFDHSQRPLEMVLPFQIVNGLSRKILDAFGQLLPNNYFITLKPGANGLIAMKYVSTASDNQNRVLVSTLSTSVLNYLKTNQLSYNLNNDFQLIGKLYQGPLILVCNSENFLNFSDLINKHHQNPDKYHFGSAGVGGLYHLNYLLLKDYLNIHSRHIPYSKDLNIAVLKGEIDYTFMGANEAIELSKTNKVTLLASTSQKRIPILSNIPTISEFDQRIVSNTTFHLMASKNMSISKVYHLNKILNQTLIDPNLVKFFKENGASISEPHSPENAMTELIKEFKKWKLIVLKNKASLNLG